jgi:glutathione S-transferase
MSLTLYDFKMAPSPRRARIFLAEKEVAYSTVPIDLTAGEHLQPAFRAINPACTVPALQLEDGTVIGDNAGIAAYVEAAFPDKPLLGRTPVERGVVASWTSRVEYEGLMAVAEALRNSAPALQDRSLTGAENYPQVPALALRGLHRIARFFDMLEARLEGRDFVTTDHFTNADIVAVVTVDFARVVRCKPSPAHANIARWRAALAGRPSLPAKTSGPSSRRVTRLEDGHEV